MSFLRALVSIPSDTGDPADTVTNTWHFDSDDPYDSTVLAGITTKLTNFYQAIDGFMAGDLLGNTATVKVYDLADDEPRVPKATFTIALTLSTGVALPSEVAAVLSFRGALESGANMKRRRGRVYLGPLTTTQIETVGGRVRWTSGFVTAVTAAAVAMRDLVTTENAKWAVFSPTTYAQTNDLDQAFEDVVAGWMDNAPDTQRRRGTASTIRTTW